MPSRRALGLARDGVKRGKLYPEQGQVGGRNPVRRGRGALPSPRVGRTSRRATAGLRWMAITATSASRDRTRLTGRLAGEILGRLASRSSASTSEGERRLVAEVAGSGPSPRRGGRCAPRCRCCRRPSPRRDRRSGSGSCGPGRGTRRRRRARPRASTWIRRRKVQRRIRCGASRYGSASWVVTLSGRATCGRASMCRAAHRPVPMQAPQTTTRLNGTATRKRY